MSIDPKLAARLHPLHEAHERIEAEQVQAAPIGSELGVQTRDWEGGLWSVRTPGLPRHPPGNQITGWNARAESRLDELLAWFDEAGCDVRIRIPAAEVDHALGRRLAARGFAIHEVEAWMAAPAAEVAPSGADHDIALVRTPDDAERFGAAFVEGWGIADPTVERVARAALAAFPGPPSWSRYVAWVDGEPAGEAILAAFGTAAYLAEASTVPRFRRRGIHRALLARRAHDAREMGADVVFGGVQLGSQSEADMRRAGLSAVSATVTLRRGAHHQDRKT